MNTKDGIENVTLNFYTAYAGGGYFLMPISIKIHKKCSKIFFEMRGQSNIQKNYQNGSNRV